MSFPSTASSSVVSVSGRTAVIGGTARDVDGGQPGSAAELACVCAMCTCGRHACPKCYVPGVPFAGQSTYREHFSGRELPPCVEDVRAWQQDAPAPNPFLETEVKRNFVGHKPVPGSGSQALGLARTNPAVGVPFMGRSTYNHFFVDKGARSENEVPAPPTVMRAPSLAPASGVPFDGRTQQSRAHQPFAHLPATDFVEMPAKGRPQPLPLLPSRFEGIGAHAEHYPPLDVDYARTRPASYKPVQVGASLEQPGLGADGAASHSNDVHGPKTLPRSPPVKVKKQFTAIAETRDFSTQSAQELPARAPQPDTTCPAARLGRPPSPSSAPAAWVGEHVLYDVGSRKWAAGAQQPTMFPPGAH